MKIEVSEPILVFAPEMNEAVARWGVYAIPRMWRMPSGELVVRFNGEADNSDAENINVAPNLYFVSHDDGESWEKCDDGEEKYDISVLTGIDPPYKKLKNGETVFICYEKDLPPIKNTPYQKEFVTPCKDAVIRTYRYGDLPTECRKVMFGKITEKGREVFEAELLFPEREIHVVSEANTDQGFVKVDEYVQPFIFRLPYFSAVTETAEGDLVALCTGQNPEVSQKYYTEVYLVASTDGGKTWRKRSTVAGKVSELPYGFGGDAGEVSLTADKDGKLYCVMRMDLSTDPRRDPHITDTMLCVSDDGGYTWSEPQSVSDSSVTPHVTTVGDALVVIYGRPGVHIKYSTDGAKSFSESISIIGKTLEEERRDGRNDFESKYSKSCSYSNTFYERISDDEIILLYNDLKYPDKNGVPTKAAFVRKIKYVK